MAGFLDDLFGTATTATDDDLYSAAAYNLMQGKAFNLPVSITPLSIPQTTQLKQAVQTAQATGDKKWEQIAGYVLKYGGAVLGILADKGIIKNKNIQAVADGEIDGDKYDELLAKGKAAVERNANDSNPNTIKFFGIELTPINLIILIVAIVLLYKAFTTESNNKK